MFAVSAALGLALFVALIPVPGGVLFAPLPLLLFLFGLTGLFTQGEDRRVRQHGGVVDTPSGWRHGA